MTIVNDLEVREDFNALISDNLEAREADLFEMPLMFSKRSWKISPLHDRVLQSLLLLEHVNNPLFLMVARLQVHHDRRCL